MQPGRDQAVMRVEFDFTAADMLRVSLRSSNFAVQERHLCALIRALQAVARAGAPAPTVTAH